MNKKKTIFIASDHAGFELKNELKTYLTSMRYSCIDLGPNKYDKDDDYPDFIIPLAEKVAASKGKAHGIVLGGSGQGEAIAANKIQGISAAVYYGGTKDILVLSKLHNNSNILSLGARFLSKKEAKIAVKLWLDTSFKNEKRHVRRTEKIARYEKRKR